MTDSPATNIQQTWNAGPHDVVRATRLIDAVVNYAWDLEAQLREALAQIEELNAEIEEANEDADNWERTALDLEPPIEAIEKP